MRCGRGLAFDEQGRDSASLLLERINAAIAAAGFAEAETIDGDSLKAGDEVGEIVGPAVGGSGRAVDIDHAREGCVAGAKVRKCGVLGGCGDSFALDCGDLLGRGARAGQGAGRDAEDCREQGRADEELIENRAQAISPVVDVFASLHADERKQYPALISSRLFQNQGIAGIETG